MPKQTFFNLPEEKRKKIIHLALEEFASHPYGRASLSNIVARAGIAKGSMYQYFDDKEDLFTYLFDLAGKEKMAYIQREVDPAADFFKFLEQSIFAGIRFSLENPRLSLVVANAMNSYGDEVVQKLVARGRVMALEFFGDMVKRAQKEGTVRSDMEPKLAANLLYGVLSTGLTEYLLDILDVTMSELLAKPWLPGKLSEEKIGRISSQLIEILRNGLAEKEKV